MIKVKCNHRPVRMYGYGPEQHSRRQERGRQRSRLAHEISSPVPVHPAESTLVGLKINSCGDNILLRPG